MSVVLVPSRNSQGRVDELVTPVGQEFCITEHEQGVRTNVCTEQYFTTRSTGQNIHRFVSNIVDGNGNINVIY